MKERSDLMSLFLRHGIGSLSDMKHIYDGEEDVVYRRGKPYIAHNVHRDIVMNKAKKWGENILMG